MVFAIGGRVWRNRMKAEWTNSDSLTTSQTTKAILVIDMPKSCEDCPCWNADDRKDWCGATNVTLTGCDIEKERPSWCPLKPMPNKKTIFHEYEFEDLMNLGWNACIDEILGETE